MYHVYVLYSRDQNKFYIGSTKSLKRRVSEHRRGKTWSTARMKDLELVYYEACISEKDAQNRERQLKTGFGRGYLRRRLRDYLGGA